MDLLTILSDPFIEKQPYSDEQAIVQHLNHLLNTRRGSLQHMPEYGLPDLHDIYHGLPYSLPDLQYALQQTIERFEPRLARITISVAPKVNANAVIQFAINAYLRSTSQQMDIHACSTAEGKFLLDALHNAS